MSSNHGLKEGTLYRVVRTISWAEPVIKPKTSHFYTIQKNDVVYLHKIRSRNVVDSAIIIIEALHRGSLYTIEFDTYRVTSLSAVIDTYLAPVTPNAV